MLTTKYAEGIKLIKKWEGCKLKAYPDPKTGGVPWTIGWGSTRDSYSRPILPGRVITQAEADAWFERDLRLRYIPAVEKLPFASEMSKAQLGALLSFAYNLGPGFYGGENFTTITRLLRNKEWNRVADALLLYSEPNNKEVHEGLLNRRRDEARLWNSGLTNMTLATKQISAKQSTFLKKHIKPASELADSDKVVVAPRRTYRVISVTPAVQGHSRVVLDFDAGSWYIFDDHWDKPEDANQVVSSSRALTLKGRFFPQTDSNTSQALRMCFSSSNAMLADWEKPGCLGNDINADDTYLTKYVAKYGDTTIAANQIKALADLGIKAEFRQNLTQQDVISILNRRTPVPVGYLHHGPVSSPRGGGHWAIIMGYDLDAKVWIVHDPMGEADLINGGFVPGRSGSFRRYSFANFNRRWEVTPSGVYKPGLGWGIVAS